MDLLFVHFPNTLLPRSSPAHGLVASVHQSCASVLQLAEAIRKKLPLARAMAAAIVPGRETGHVFFLRGFYFSGFGVNQGLENSVGFEITH